MDNESGGFLGQFSEHEAAPLKYKHANREDTTKPYINNNPTSREAMQTTQEDLNYYAWNRFIRFAQPHNEFEQSVNKEFKENNPPVDGKNFDAMRDKYKALYKRMLSEL